MNVPLFLLILAYPTLVVAAILAVYYNYDCNRDTDPRGKQASAILSLSFAAVSFIAFAAIVAIHCR